MKITKVIIENYKSIKHLEFEPNKGLNAFIGENSVGKSNIFKAINWVLGPVYPTFNSVKYEDHFMGDPNNKILVQIHFDDGNCFELNEDWTDSYGNKKACLNFNGGYVKDEVRTAYSSAYLGVDRQINDYLPSNKWTLMGRFLQDVNNLFLKETMECKDGSTILKKDKLKELLNTIRDKLLFSVKNQDGEEIMKKFLEILQEESAKQLNREDEFSLDLSLYDPWNFYRSLNLTVKDSDLNIPFKASDLGMGVQASISIAILKAYSQLKLANETPIFIDEPELFLHPQAQRNFYKIIQELAENGTQVFYTTHSPCFLSAGRFNEIFLVRKSKKNATYINYGDVTNFVEDLKLRIGIKSSDEDLLLQYQAAYDLTGDTQKANEAFFAKKVILVEGQSETLILPYLFELAEFDYIKEGLSIVQCGSKSELDRFYRLYSEFGIPCYIIFDGDKSKRQIIST